MPLTLTIEAFQLQIQVELEVVHLGEDILSNQLLYHMSIVSDMFMTKYVIGIIMVDTLLTSTIRYIARTY